MEKLKWCFTRKKGLKLVEENKNLSQEYLENAEESIRALSNIKETRSRMWLATIKYYIKYFAVYAFLMRVGIKCEIHDCTIEFTGCLGRHGFLPEGTNRVLEEDKKLRIDNQYYLKNRPVNIDLEQLRDFVLEIKRRIDNLSDEDITKIRSVQKS